MHRPRLILLPLSALLALLSASLLLRSFFTSDIITRETTRPTPAMNTYLVDHLTLSRGGLNLFRQQGTFGMTPDTQSAKLSLPIPIWSYTRSRATDYPSSNPSPSLFNRFGFFYTAIAWHHHGTVDGTTSLTLPLWPFLLLSCLLPVKRLTGSLRPPLPPTACPTCHYDLRAHPPRRHLPRMRHARSPYTSSPTGGTSVSKPAATRST